MFGSCCVSVHELQNETRKRSAAVLQLQKKFTSRSCCCCCCQTKRGEQDRQAEIIKLSCALCILHSFPLPLCTLLFLLLFDVMCKSQTTALLFLLFVSVFVAAERGSVAGKHVSYWRRHTLHSDSQTVPAACFACAMNERAAQQAHSN